MTPQELKNSILQRAIQGKLVEQRPEEGIVEVLYKKIQTEKQKLVKEGKIKKDKPQLPITDEEKPFDIPDSWMWVRFKDVCKIVNGFTPSRSNTNFWNGEIPWFTIDDVHDQGRFISHTKQSITKQALSKNSERIVPPDTVLLCCTASVGEYAYTKISLTTNQQFNALVIRDEYKNVLCPMYLYEFSQTLKKKITNDAGKTTFNFLSVGKLENFLLPIPPLEEQKRIVAKIEELLPYVDRYEKAWTKLEDFNKRFPVDMQKSVLQMAIQGKLVEQRPEEGTGEELYKKIQAEKQKLIKEGKIKKDKSLTQITDEEKPFEIPDSWMWVRLGECSDYSKKNEKVTPDKIDGLSWILDLEDIEKESGKILTRTLAKNKKINGDKIVFHKGQVLYSKLRPYLKKILVAPADGICSSEIVPFDLYGKINSQYMVTVLKSPYVDFYINSVTYGVKMPRVGTDTMINLIIPLPPLAEQKRIVAKLDEILPLCEKLK